MILWIKLYGPLDLQIINIYQTSLGRKAETKKEEDDTKEEDEDQGVVKRDNETDDESDDKDDAKEEADVRDIRYSLETLPL